MEELLEYSLARTIGPAAEPLTTADAKTHCNIAASDTNHDAYLSQLITQAREQVEIDTGLCLINQTWTMTMDCFESGEDDCCIYIPKRPVSSITSIYYKDLGGTSTLLSSSVYALDAPRQCINLKYNQYWPSVRGDWDSVVITFVAGYGTNGSAVPMIAKQCMLLLIGHWFENRDMLLNETTYNRKAYDDLVARIQRGSYP